MWFISCHGLGFFNFCISIFINHIFFFFLNSVFCSISSSSISSSSIVQSYRLLLTSYERVLTLFVPPVMILVWWNSVRFRCHQRCGIWALLFSGISHPSGVLFYNRSLCCSMVIYSDTFPAYIQAPETSGATISKSSRNLESMSLEELDDIFDTPASKHVEYQTKISSAADMGD